MRKFFLTAFVLAATLCLAGSSFALEKTSVTLSDDSRPDGWSAGSSCYIIYYNFCTGWVWVWSGWTPGDILGVCVNSCCPAGTASSLDVSWHFIRTGSPAGYGFTGQAQVSAANASCCPTGAPIASQTFLPVAGWNGYLWGASVPSTFVVTVSTGPGAVPANPMALDTEHAAAGPTGPAACGFCWPVGRVNHSFYYGTATAPLCPGSPFNDGVCDNELRWEFGLTCSTISVEESSWGTIKNLYR
jgi:hypothetical protein